ncbi:L-rhamnose mutarotase [Caulobacter sp. S45]|jgi:L-rhamnose mutarotase|uniref:L-rhamnose mutarotase n=1 Tax=Caulobacter sp. S45 TaxID=1641861 RepID=UPI00131D9439|nr:L-rhamnose mutarotase [Caulobacter sp. S45]
MARRCLILDLKDDPELIARYKQWHTPGRTPPAVIAAIRAAGVEAMEIYLSGDRLVMIMETGPEASDDVRADASPDPELRAWEQLMDAFQKPVPWATPGEKWTPTELIFDLDAHG